MHNTIAITGIAIFTIFTAPIIVDGITKVAADTGIQPMGRVATPTAAAVIYLSLCLHFFIISVVTPFITPSVFLIVNSQTSRKIKMLFHADC